MTLIAFAAERRVAAPLLLSAVQQSTHLLDPQQQTRRRGRQIEEAD